MTDAVELGSVITLTSLARRPLWVAWQTEVRETGKPPTKVPYSPGGKRASANDPLTWGPRQAAEKRAAMLPRPFGQGGIGIEFYPLGDGRNLAGIDLDTCRNPETAEMATWAEAVLSSFDSYAEISPSQTGAKLFCTYDSDALQTLRDAMAGPLFGKQFKRGSGEHPPAIELHLGNRYFAVTDDLLPGAPTSLRHVPVETFLRLLKVEGPAFVGTKQAAGAASSPSADQSRSATAMRHGAALVRAGASFDAMVAGLAIHPETAAWCAEKGTAAGQRELRRIYEKAEKSIRIDGFDLTEDGIAQAFTKRHADRLRYCHDAGAWFQWTGQRWRQDRTKLAYSWARQTCRELAANTPDNKRVTLAKAATAGAVERFAQADPALTATASVWDADPFLLGTPEGTVDLRTGSIRPGCTDDYLTKQTAVAPAETPHTPLWDAFLLDATAGDTALIRFLRQWFGYCLTGDTREHALLFGYGPGGNGKSVLLNTAAGIMGDYCRQAAMDTFTAAHGDRHPTDLAMLRGARMVCASETEEGRAWAESRIKSLTGGDMISARFMRQDFFEYRPQFKLVVIGNHKPVLKNVDEAARRRFNVVPFLNTPSVPDRQLETKLKAEWPAILRWMIEGCLDWQRNGLVRPKVVATATAEYFEAQDYFGRWLSDCAIMDQNLASKPSVLLSSFREWCAQNGEPMTDNRAMRGMIERTPPLRYVTLKGSQLVRGIGLKPPPKGGGGVDGGGGSDG